MEKTKRNILILCASLVCIVGITSLAGLVSYIGVLWFRIAALVSINLLNGAVALAAMKLAGMELSIEVKNIRQYLIGIFIALSLSAVIAVIPALCGVSLVGQHSDFSWFSIVYDFLFYLLVIGPVEELVFRVYLQDAFVSFFAKHKWLGVVLAAFLFGLWHLIHGTLIQVVFTFGIGLVFGFAKYKIKDCSYLSVALGHGLYDFLNTLVRMFIV